MNKEIKINGFWITLGLIIIFIALAALSNFVDQVFNFKAGSSIEYIGGLAFVVLVIVIFRIALNLAKRKHEQESYGGGGGDAGGLDELTNKEDSKYEIEVSENTSIGYSGDSGGSGDAGGSGDGG